jgi:hypothetical protein
MLTPEDHLLIASQAGMAMAKYDEDGMPPLFLLVSIDWRTRTLQMSGSGRASCETALYILSEATQALLQSPAQASLGTDMREAVTTPERTAAAIAKAQEK